MDHLLTAENVDRLLDVLSVGRAAAKTSDEIQRALGFPRQRTNEATRALVAFAVNDHHHLILSGVAGFWIALDRLEVLDAIRSLEARRIGIAKRIAALEEAYHLRRGEDLT